ncbi:hypothetical protein CRUP_037871, partial [Coryphaenoides rupestris]
KDRGWLEGGGGGGATEAGWEVVVVVVVVGLQRLAGGWWWWCGGGATEAGWRVVVVVVVGLQRLAGGWWWGYRGWLGGVSVGYRVEVVYLVEPISMLKMDTPPLSGLSRLPLRWEVGFIRFNEVLVNDGGHYNRHTGVFTAPLTGRYHLSAVLTARRGARVEAVLSVSNRIVQKLNTAGFPRPHEDLSRPPEDLSRPHEDLSRPPEDLSRPHEDLSRPPEDLSRPPEDLSRPT